MLDTLFFFFLSPPTPFFKGRFNRHINVLSKKQTTKKKKKKSLIQQQENMLNSFSMSFIWNRNKQDQGDTLSDLECVGGTYRTCSMAGLQSRIKSAWGKNRWSWKNLCCNPFFFSFFYKTKQKKNSSSLYCCIQSVLKVRDSVAGLRLSPRRRVGRRKSV